MMGHYTTRAVAVDVTLLPLLRLSNPVGGIGNVDETFYGKTKHF